VDAITIAYAAAAHEVLHGRLAKQQRERPDLRQAMRTVAGGLARQLGTTDSTLMSTLDGDRWVTLSDVVAALQRENDIAPVFIRQLDEYLRSFHYLLCKDAPVDPTPTPRRVAAAGVDEGASVETDTDRLKEAEVLDLERRARESITALSSAQQRARTGGRALPSDVDWLAVSAALDPYRPNVDSGDSQAPQDEVDGALPGRADKHYKSLTEYGVENMNATVLEAFGDGGPLSAAEVIDRVRSIAHQRQTERGLKVDLVPANPIRNALWRLHSRPDDPDQRWLIHDGSTYKAGPRLLREGGGAKR
jgi:hypothetical protein